MEGKTWDALPTPLLLLTHQPVAPEDGGLLALSRGSRWCPPQSSPVGGLLRETLRPGGPRGKVSSRDGGQ